MDEIELAEHQAEANELGLSEPDEHEPSLSEADQGIASRVAWPYKLVQCRHGLMLANSMDFYIGNGLIQYGEYSELEFAVLTQLINGSGAVVEVGANVGSLTVALAKRAAEFGQMVYVYEPQPFIFQNLNANLALNALGNVRAYPFACGASNTELYFTPPDYTQENNFGAVELGSERAPQDQAVPCVRLDEHLAGVHVGLIKVDVEGLELEVFKGSQQLIQRCRPILYFENDRLHLSEALISWVQAQGYRLWWHTPPLFNPNNFNDYPENLYPFVCSINMIALPYESGLQLNGFTEVNDAAEHLLKGD